MPVYQYRSKNSVSTVVGVSKDRPSPTPQCTLRCSISLLHLKVPTENGSVSVTREMCVTLTAGLQQVEVLCQE